MKTYKATQELPHLNVKADATCQADPGDKLTKRYLRRGWLVEVKDESPKKDADAVDKPAPKKRGRPRKADK